MAASINHAGGEAAFIDAVAMSSTAGEIDNAICLLLAGRAAERLTLGDFSVGSGVDEGSDLARATALSEMLETKGAGTAGNLYLPDDMARNLMHVAGLINAVKARLDKAEARATAILEANRTLLDRVAARLDVEGYLSAADIEQLEISPLVLEAAE
jgi:ATP-dependent Zn protease